MDDNDDNDDNDGRKRQELYERRAKELAELSRAERFDQLIEFPALHMFKVIGAVTGFGDELTATLLDCGYRDVLFIERPSKGGRYVAITFKLTVDSGAELDRIYLALEKMTGVKYVL